ncbi:hypothetical protein GCM10010267_61760 [Streptomyces griseorubens]|nr:hypothetical protein GCM10010267_61760 [Streptomyces griseorubens]
MGEDGAREAGGAVRGSEDVHAEAVSAAAAPATKVRRFTGGLPDVGWGTACHGTRGGASWAGAPWGRTRAVRRRTRCRPILGTPPGPRHSPVWFSASLRARLLALRAGPRQPQVQRAVQKGPCSVVVVRWRRGSGASSWCGTPPTVTPAGPRDGAPDRSLTPLTAARVGRSGGRQGWREGDSTGGRTA